MKRNFFFGVVAASAMVLATSCSSDVLESTTATTGNDAQVTFNVTADAAVSTRAISDGSGANTLVYRVFDKDGKAISGLTKTTVNSVTDFDKGHAVTLTLAKGQTYKVAFWAQNSKCTAYTVGDDMNVTVNYDNAANNDEDRDAFFKTVEITVKKDEAHTVTLTRPFAQINVGNTDDDVKAAKASGIEISTSSVTIKNVASKLNVVTGATSIPTEVTYTAAAIPSETFSADMDNSGKPKTYNYLSMCYVLPYDGSATGTEKMLTEVKFTFTPSSGKAIELSEGLQNIPIQRNYRTNIAGDILAAKQTFNVTIDNKYIADHNHVLVSNNTELATAIKENGAEVQLAASNEAYTLPKDIGNYVTLTGVDKENTKIEATAANYYDDKNITLENLTYSNSSGNYVGLVRAESVNYKNCIITGKPTMYATTATFDNCTFKQDIYEYCIWTYASKTVTFNKCTFETKGKAVKIYNEGGNGSDVYFNNCTFKSDPDQKAEKAAIEIDVQEHVKNNTAYKFNVYINSCTASDFKKGNPSGETMWNVEHDNTNKDYATVTVDGSQVYPTKE